jgi:misacylated tRNA(Ala) deacylase
VTRVLKQGGAIRHFVDRSPEEDRVTGRIDWGRRYAHMRMHTAQHLLSGLVFQMYTARTVGNQLYRDYSHVDFSPASFSQDDLRRIEAEFNRAVEAKVPVTIYEEDRGALEERIEEERAILNIIPRGIKRLRVVQIGELDICPCAGTHVRNTSEIGRMRILRRRSKGRDVDRVTYELVEPAQ